MNDEEWMGKALEIAEGALKNGDFPVGCVLVVGDKLAASGRRKNSFGPQANELDHAEIVALRNFVSQGQQPRNDDITAYCTLEPCLMCLGALILNGVRRVVYAYEDVMGGAAGTNLGAISSGIVSGVGTGKTLYALSRIEIRGGVRRRESLKLFKRFFLDPSRSYWKKSLLYSYTLAAED